MWREVWVVQQLKEDLDMDMVRQFEEWTTLGGPLGLYWGTWRGHADIRRTERVDLRRILQHQRFGPRHEEGLRVTISNSTRTHREQM